MVVQDIRVFSVCATAEQKVNTGQKKMAFEKRDNNVQQKHHSSTLGCHKKDHSPSITYKT